MRDAACLVAAVVLSAAAGVVIPAAPASAATCSTGDGVTVVVDFHELGGGIQAVCDAAGGGEAASRLFPDNGFPLTYVQRQPGFVCRVSGAPTADDDSCVNTPPPDAYWGLWWSDGESGSWTYSSEGVAALNVPEGGSVALSWNGSTTKSPPGISPPTHEDEQPSPSPTPQPSGQPGGASGGAGGAGSAGGGATGGGPSTAPSETPTSSPSGSAVPGEGGTSGGGSGKRSPATDDDKGADTEGNGTGRRDEESAQPADESTTAAVAVLTADPPSDAGAEGLPTWVAPVGIAGLFGLAGAVALLRRRSMA